MKGFALCTKNTKYVSPMSYNHVTYKELRYKVTHNVNKVSANRMESLTKRKRKLNCLYTIPVADTYVDTKLKV